MFVKRVCIVGITLPLEVTLDQSISWNGNNAETKEAGSFQHPYYLFRYQVDSVAWFICQHVWCFMYWSKHMLTTEHCLNCQTMFWFYNTTLLHIQACIKKQATGHKCDTPTSVKQKSCIYIYICIYVYMYTHTRNFGVASRGSGSFFRYKDR